MRYVYFMLFSALLGFNIQVQCSSMPPHVQIAEELLFHNESKEIYARDIAPLFKEKKLTIEATLRFLKKDCIAAPHCCNWAEDSIVEGTKKFQAEVNPAALSFSELENVCAALYVLSCCNKVLADYEAAQNHAYNDRKAAEYAERATELNTLAYTLCRTYCDPFIKKAEESKTAADLHEGVKAVKLLSLLSAKLPDSVEKENVRYYLDQKKDSLAIKYATVSCLELEDVEALFDLGKLTYDTIRDSSNTTLLHSPEAINKETAQKLVAKIQNFAGKLSTSPRDLSFSTFETVTSALWLIIMHLEKTSPLDLVNERKKAALNYCLSAPFKKCIESFYDSNDINTLRAGLSLIDVIQDFLPEQEEDEEDSKAPAESSGEDDSSEDESSTEQLSTEEEFISTWQDNFLGKIRALKEKARAAELQAINKKSFESALKAIKPKIEEGTLTIPDVAPLRIETIVSGDWRSEILRSFIEVYKDPTFAKATEQSKSTLPFEKLENTLACLYLMSYGCEFSAQAMEHSRAIVARNFSQFVQLTGDDKISSSCPAFFVLDRNESSTNLKGCQLEAGHVPFAQAYGVPWFFSENRKDALRRAQKDHCYNRTQNLLTAYLSLEETTKIINAFKKSYYAPTFWPYMPAWYTEEACKFVTRYIADKTYAEIEDKLTTFENLVTQLLIAKEFERDATKVKMAEEHYEKLITNKEPWLYQLVGGTVDNTACVESNIKSARKALSLLKQIWGDSLEAGFLEETEAALAEHDRRIAPLRESFAAFWCKFDGNNITMDLVKKRKQTLSQNEAFFFLFSYKNSIMENAERLKGKTDLAFNYIENACAALWLLQQCAEMAHHGGTADDAREMIEALWNTAKLTVSSAKATKDNATLEEIDEGLRAIALSEFLYPDDPSVKLHARGIKPVLEKKKASLTASIDAQKRAREDEDKRKSKGSGNSSASKTSGSSLLTRLLSHKRLLLAGGVTLIAAGIGSYFAYQKWGTKPKQQPKPQR